MVHGAEISVQVTAQRWLASCPGSNWKLGFVSWGHMVVESLKNVETSTSVSATWSLRWSHSSASGPVVFRLIVHGHVESPLDGHESFYGPLGPGHSMCT